MIIFITLPFGAFYYFYYSSPLPLGGPCPFLFFFLSNFCPQLKLLSKSKGKNKKRGPLKKKFVIFFFTPLFILFFPLPAAFAAKQKQGKKKTKFFFSFFIGRQCGKKEGPQPVAPVFYYYFFLPSSPRGVKKKITNFFFNSPLGARAYFYSLCPPPVAVGPGKGQKKNKKGASSPLLFLLSP